MGERRKKLQRFTISIMKFLMRWKDVGYAWMSLLIGVFWTAASTGSVLYALTTGQLLQTFVHFARKNFSLSHVFQCMILLGATK